VGIEILSFASKGDPNRSHHALSHLKARAKDNHLVIQPIDFFLVEPRIANLHPSGEGPACAQLFDSITDGFGCRRKTPVVGVSTSALRQIQFSR
jgi:hypothetical protein